MFRGFGGRFEGALSFALVGLAAASAGVACRAVEVTTDETGVGRAGRGGAGAGGSGTGGGSGGLGGAGAAGATSAGSGGLGGAGGGPQPFAVACPAPVQDAVDTSGWPEIVVGTSDHFCTLPGEPGVGTYERPYCNPHAALAAVQKSGTIVTFLQGEYRLVDLPKPGGSSVGALALPGVPSSASSFVIVRAAKGAKPLLFGSQHLHGTRAGWIKWAGPPGAPTIYRLPVESLPHDPRGLWETLPFSLPPHEVVHRFRHVMTIAGNAVVHADVASLSDGAAGTVESSTKEPSATRDFTWTKADGNGVGCGEANQGCYVYLRVDDDAYDPGLKEFEISQVDAFESAPGGAAYAVIDGLHTRFTQCEGPSCGLVVDGSDELVVRNGSFGHFAGGAALRFTGTNGSKVYDNAIFDAASWEGAASSRGISFTLAGETGPNWVCRNDVYDIPGVGIGSGTDVRDFWVLGNHLHDSTTCVGTSRNRENLFNSGGWRVQQNLFQRCATAVALEGIFFQPPPFDRVVNNVFVDNHVGVAFKPASAVGTSLHNNVFLGGPLANACEGPRCGAAIFFDNDISGAPELAYLFDELQLETSHNAYFGFTQAYGLHRNDEPTYQGYSALQMQALYGAEKSSVVDDPLLDGDYRPLPGSPLLGAGYGAAVGLSKVNIGRFLQ